ncbi:dihydrolipoyl dehydrogenase family protein [Candidatus Phycosocius spiralis]|uniref:Dihydrolipoamide dehydrogenase n=1 Tax=Candidatus Phycosocius spiralis TaxID=2815099 RepID=A0ABQ4PUZ0_9PROT|nr:FAD-dependent oxidoreductase [Candidatus Phycosocius spiralis]GIU66699.1 dihydrolipoamide dehydrogenase [Candidatus Phycosocius spiralis]
MTQQTFNVDVCVIGAGAAGLSVAAGAAQLGLSVVLFEAGEMGGDCLNTGCVPSKSLIAASKIAHNMRHAAEFGLKNVKPVVDWNKVRNHVDGVIATIAPIDSQERFESLGCSVVREHANFISPHVLESPSARVKARRFVIATGARAAIPPITGLHETPFLTNETVFTQDSLPHSLIVLGGGAVGVELGQAFARLGTLVTIVEAANIMGPQDPEAVQAVRTSLQADGIKLLEGAKAVIVTGDTDQVSVTLEDGRVLEAQRLLVAVGRTARVENLGLEKAKVVYSKKGVETDQHLRSISNPRVWAVGDVAGKEQLTHAAGFQASVFIRNALFKAPAKAQVSHMPAVAYCEPELARIGLTEIEAYQQFKRDVMVTKAEFSDNDRAQTERTTTGFCKLVIGKGGKILGATIVGEGAGEAIQLVGMVMANNQKVGALTNLISPYPTRSEIVKRAAGAYFTPRLFSEKTRKLIRFLKNFG